MLDGTFVLYLISFSERHDRSFRCDSEEAQKRDALFRELNVK
jgi:hypothetical protein